MSRSRKISGARLEIYTLAIAGNCQKSICGITGRSKSTVSEHIAKLLDFKAIIEVSGPDKVKFYGKGEKASILDATLTRHSSEISRGGRETTHDKLRTTEPNSELLLPLTCEVHSHGVRAMVNHLGDMQWMREPSAPLNSGVGQFFGKVELEDGRVFSVKYMESPKTEESWLYVWVNTELTTEQLKNEADAVLMGIAQKVFNYISKHYGWKFGIMENHKGSKTHYVPSSTLVDALASIVPENENIETEKMHTDRSPPREDGLPTIETKDKATAIGLMTNLEEMLAMKDKIDLALLTLAKNQEATLQILKHLTGTQDSKPKTVIQPDEESGGNMYG